MLPFPSSHPLPIKILPFGNISGIIVVKNELVVREISIRCGHVVRDFESEAKTRCNFQFR